MRQPKVKRCACKHPSRPRQQSVLTELSQDWPLDKVAKVTRIRKGCQERFVSRPYGYSSSYAQPLTGDARQAAVQIGNRGAGLPADSISTTTPRSVGPRAERFGCAGGGNYETPTTIRSMSKPHHNRADQQSAADTPQSRLPRDRLQRVTLGKSFAEYDPLLREQDIYVVTPAIDAASTPARFASFFVGRRGTGKTAITLYLTKRNKRTFTILPQQFVPTINDLGDEAYRDTRQRPFNSLKEAFTRALLTETLHQWIRHGLVGRNALPDELRRHLPMIEDHEFDSRLLTYIEHVTSPLVAGNDASWLKQMKVSDSIISLINQHYADVTNQTLLLIDRIDEAWDGSDRAVIYLMAMMHATVEMSSKTNIIRPVIFLRENIFERVRQVDNEFGRLETSVTSLDWTPELLRELVERRLAKPFVTKLKLHGDTWDAFFAPYEGHSSFEHVAEFCQHRPRDVLTYCTLAIQNAVSVRHERVEPSDFQSARKTFSSSRLKDLSDEYAENFPNIGLILGRFYGLGTRYTFNGVASFIERLIVDEEVKAACGSWIFQNTQPERFIELLYSIGFYGISEAGDPPTSARLACLRVPVCASHPKHTRRSTEAFGMR